jgi:Leucine-rich repeat (LRR) protein
MSVHTGDGRADVSLTSLNLSGIITDDARTATALPQAIRQLTGLTSLRLSDCEITMPEDAEEETITAICSAIGSLPALTSLDLSGVDWFNFVNDDDVDLD